MEQVIYNGKIITPQTNENAYLAGAEMAALKVYDPGWVSFSDGLISGIGEGKPGSLPQSGAVDAAGGLILPAFCDSHTHLVFAGSREQEFEDKIRGLSYEEIARRGGGILNSARLLRETDEEELFRQAMERIREIILTGTGAVEIKSGYGLTTEDELKMLRVIKRLADEAPITVRRTFLGAHAVPEAFRGRQEAYVDMLIAEMLPAVAQEGLADYIDVFCDRGFFTVRDTERILEAGARYGLVPKIHANELDYSGGIQTGVRYGARSVDHLEYTGEEEILILKGSGTMPTVLPGASFFLGLPYAPARKMIDAGLPLALASDFNPGSSPSGNIPFILSLATIKLRMLPSEALTAVTLNGAYAMGLEHSHGSLEPGKVANIIITRPVSDLASLPYFYGSRLIDRVILGGKLIS